MSGESNWKQGLFDVPSGTHILLWRYVKDIGGDLGTDSGYGDQVVYVTNDGPPTQVVQPTDKKIAVGATVTLRAGIAGAAPLSYLFGATSGQASVALANSDRTIVNGFALEDASGSTCPPCRSPDSCAVPAASLNSALVDFQERASPCFLPRI